MPTIESLKRAVKSPARKCFRLLGIKRGPAGGTPPSDPLQLTPFVCNVCGAPNRLPRGRLTREDGHCGNCNCYGRLRSMAYALTARFSPDELVLARMAPRKDVRGLGCSDWGYAALLAEKFDYVNTFFDREPRLDLSDVDWSRWRPDSFDFITCTDVLEHIEPPIEKTFGNIYRLLKPGGAAVLTVPTMLEENNREHFPNLADWEIVTEEDGRRVLVNRRPDGVIERFDNPCFHGGEGMTLEFRLFSRRGFIDSVRGAGFHEVKILDQPIDAHAIPLDIRNFVLVAEKSGRDGPGRATARILERNEPHE